MKLESIALEGRYVRLEPLAPTHCAGLTEAIRDGELWNLHVTIVPHTHEVPEFIDNAMRAYTQGSELAFATVERRTGQIAGSTRFMKVELRHRRAEIGFTFLGRSWQRTAINTEAKLLMLEHAFEALGLNRVEFLTDVLNDRSRAAIARLGALQEGVLRSHMVMRDGRIRDSVLFSITRSDWSRVRQHLTARLSQP